MTFNMTIYSIAAFYLLELRGAVFPGNNFKHLNEWVALGTEVKK